MLCVILNKTAPGLSCYNLPPVDPYSSGVRRVFVMISDIDYFSQQKYICRYLKK